MSTDNDYEKKAKRNKALNGAAGTAADKNLPIQTRAGKAVMPTLINTVLTVGGGFAGAAMGRFSFLTGILLAGTGEVMGSPGTVSFGLGMIASNVSSFTTPTVEGTEKKSKMEMVKERVKSYGKGFMEKLYLDKLIKKKETTETKTEEKKTETAASTTTEKTAGTVGEVKYFTYPMGEKADPMDLRELERYEKEIQKSAENFAKENITEDSPAKENVSGSSMTGFYSDDKLM